MAINVNALNPRLADRRLYLVAAAMFPLLVLIGYARTYYFSSFFDVKPLANALVHAHAVAMSAWVAFFSAQVFLIRTKNIKLHMTMGWVGVALAALTMIGGFELFRGFDQYRMLVFGLAMVLIMIWRPRGIIGHRSPTIYLQRAEIISSDLVKEGHG